MRPNHSELSLNTSVSIPDFGKVKVISTTNTRGCVDPRDSLIGIDSQNDVFKRVTHMVDAMRSPGASMGSVMSLIGAVPDLAVPHAVNLVDQWERSQGRTFTLHEDDSGPEKLGCGHVDSAMLPENEGAYGIPSDKVAELKTHVFEQAKAGALEVTAPVLTGKHDENGVLVVSSRKNSTVIPRTGEYQFFRFDETNHNKGLHSLATFVRKQGVVVATQRILSAADQQRTATLGLLAAELPVYTLNLDEHPKSQERVVFSGKVPGLR